MIDWDAIRDDVTHLYSVENKTSREIADKYGIPEGSVQRFLWKEGIRKNPDQIKENHKRGAEGRSFEEQACEICNGKYSPSSGSQRYCKTCIPNLGARKRYESYKITAPEWDRLLAKQGGICKLCPEPATVVDHNHKTGELRGLLCTPCNTALNRMEIDGWNDKAMQYLSSNLAFSPRQHWLVWKLIESLRARNIPFEGPNGEFSKDFDNIKDKCLDKAFDYDPTKG
jgi:hypothetical protein